MLPRKYHLFNIRKKIVTRFTDFTSNENLIIDHSLLRHFIFKTFNNLISGAMNGMPSARAPRAEYPRVRFIFLVLKRSSSYKKFRKYKIFRKKIHNSHSGSTVQFVLHLFIARPHGVSESLRVTEPELYVKVPELCA